MVESSDSKQDDESIAAEEGLDIDWEKLGIDPDTESNEDGFRFRAWVVDRESPDGGE